MASIPWWAWLGIGLFVAITSSQLAHIEFFIWVGLAFIAIGIGKLIFVVVATPREEQGFQAKQQTTQYPKYTQAQNPYATYCSRCGTRAYGADVFCRRCGTRVR